MLRVDRSEQMDIPALQGFNMIRTGVLGDGSCFLHSIFTSMNARLFTGLTTEQRIEYTRTQRHNLAERLTFENWASLSNGVVSIQEFSETIVNSIPFLVKRISGKPSKKLKEEKPEIYEAIERNKEQLKGLDIQRIVRDALHNGAGHINNLNAFIENFFRNIQNEYLLDLMRAVVNDGVPSLFRKYKEYIDSSDAVDNTLITFLSDAYNINIILINADGSIYSSRTDITDMMLNDRPFILMNYLNEFHFESIAEVGPEYNIRVFYRQSPVIQAILRYITQRVSPQPQQVLMTSDDEEEKAALERLSRVALERRAGLVPPINVQPSRRIFKEKPNKPVPEPPKEKPNKPVPKPPKEKPNKPVPEPPKINFSKKREPKPPKISRRIPPIFPVHFNPGGLPPQYGYYYDSEIPSYLLDPNYDFEIPSHLLDPNLGIPQAHKAETSDIIRKYIRAAGHPYPHTPKDDCVICTEPLVENVVLVRHENDRNIEETKRIDHCFHKDCIIEWLRDHENCPICRERAMELIVVV